MDQRKEIDVVVLGELNVDIILNRIKGMSEVGKEILCDDMAVTLGSSSAIFASNLSTLGAKVAFIGKTGCDDFASLVIRTLEDKGVLTGSVIHSETSKTGATVALNYDEDRAMVTYPGAMNEFCLSDIDFDFVKKARHLHFSSYFLQPGIRRDLKEILKKTKEMGLTTSMDPQWDPDQSWDMNCEELLPYVDVFLPNAAEIQNLTGTESNVDAIQKLKPVSNVIVIKNGSKGALMWDGREMVFQPIFHNEQVVDCIGAGDSFNAGFVLKYVQRKPLAECLEFGALTGAINTTGVGGTGAFSSYEDVRLIASQRFNYHI